jgi:putative ABC transport system permease protein
MSWMRFLHRKRSDSELQDEIEAFLTEETADNEARGLTPDEARRQARLKFGNPQKMRESLWMQNTPQRLAGIARDIKYAFRTLSRTPGFTIIAVAVMALCIGAATSLFTVVRSVLLRPLPFRDPARLVMVYEHFRGGELSYHPVAPAGFYDWRSKTHGFEDMAIMLMPGTNSPVCATNCRSRSPQQQVPQTCFHCWECGRHWAGTFRRRTISAAAPL